MNTQLDFAKAGIVTDAMKRAADGEPLTAEELRGRIAAGQAVLPKNIHHDWRNIVRIMNTQKEVVTTLKPKKGKTIRVKKCSVPSVEAKQIYEALGYKTVPYYMKKSVLPEI